MTRRWVVSGAAAAAVLVAGVGAVAIASPWSDDADETAAAGNGAAVATQARWGQGYGGSPGHGSGHGAGHGQQSGDPAANLPASGDISEATEQELLYMAEEEKLAHDLYVALGEQYDAQQFDTIANAETKHLDAVRVLLDRYDLDDPTVGMPPGEFANDDLQALYDDLLASGSESLADAAQAGITVETTDIADLSAALEGTDAADVTQVLSSLRDGSEKHLAAFERLAERA